MSIHGRRQGIPLATVSNHEKEKGEKNPFALNSGDDVHPDEREQGNTTMIFKSLGPDDEFVGREVRDRARIRP